MRALVLERATTVLILVLFVFLCQALAESGESEKGISATEPGRITVPVIGDRASPELSFVIDKPEAMTISTALARKIFLETLHGVTGTLNPYHAAKVHLRLTLRLGQPGNLLHITHGDKDATIISLKKWDDTTFARLAARAIRSSLLSDKQLDDVAVEALKRVHQTVSVDELARR
ncbi:MAG TPA: hypothetical protein VFI95_15605 [Terriglobales bacterium]|nr:hypothetical protein [Terriglobales bacterium]